MSFVAGSASQAAHGKWQTEEEQLWRAALAEPRKSEPMGTAPVAHQVMSATEWRLPKKKSCAERPFSVDHATTPTGHAEHGDHQGCNRHGAGHGAGVVDLHGDVLKASTPCRRRATRA